jgi:hypothetical protein
MVYPGSTPEFRILVKPDGTQVLQIRHINITQGYTGKWQDVPVVLESVENVENTGVTNG